MSTVATTGDYDDLENKPELFSGSYNDLTDKPDLFSGDYEDLTNKPTIPTDTSDLTNGAGFITGITSTDVTTALGYTPYNSSNPSGYITSSALSGYATETWVGEQGYLTSVAWEDISSKPTFAAVAASGDYEDLENTPTIPDAVSGTNDGTNWTTLTIGNDTYNVGGGSNISISQTTTPGTASRPETTTTSITIDGTTTNIASYTAIDTALSSSSKNPVANNIIYNAVSNKVDAEDFQELEKIALTTKGVMSGTALQPVLSITDGIYYPTVSDSGSRWKMGKADSPTFYKIYDVSQYTSVHLKSVSRAGHILTDTAPSDFNVHMHQESPAT